ncbi:MAG: molybdopterin biosynthesis protein [Thermanaeromonas sp.]|uniref:molybdopterin biosynthesis protein n=1 Tax=Thermanaeromonas sp. TaxID=2003697 RepID=UPI00243CCE8A|nr:molybdopterin biosynthesis protein [Thermanaeromonas sp.]MCG0278567.1 molybdopterin biosynthesis protein [Thermanaeromonas sp.]
MGERKVFLDNRPWQEAREEFIEALRTAGFLQPTPAETIPTQEALGRVTAEAVYALLSSPHYVGAAMDGIAVRAEVTWGASEGSPKRLALGREAWLVDTGDPLPEGCNAVIMLENITLLDENTVEIYAPAVPWQHVRLPGEDILAGEMLVPANHTLTAFDLAAFLSAGVAEVKVRKKPRVAILPTGSELVPVTSTPQPGQILETNSVMLASLVRQWGGDPQVFPITPDDYGLLKDQLKLALAQSDIVVINAGSSAGREDYTASLVGELGRVLTHGVATKPGKPVILGLVEGKPVLGVPGYPVSAAICAELFLRPLVYMKQGLNPPEPLEVRAVLGRKMPSSLGREEFVRVRLAQMGEKLVATPLGRGAGNISSLARADGILRIPRLSEGYPAGAEVRVVLLKALEEIRNTLVIAGSDDPLLFVLGDVLRRAYPARRLAVSPVGSLIGLNALRRGEVHGASIHLLDPASGTYNVPYVEDYLRGQQVVLVNLAYRQNGLIVAPGNPKGIKSLKDLGRKDITFINRQPGSGTRVLLEHHLRLQELDVKDIQGYEHEETTHLGVADRVARGLADVGLGIYAAAKAYQLEFIPVAVERLDLCFLREQWETLLVQDLIKVMASEEFRRAAGRLPGYDLKDCGQVVWKNF